MTQKFFVAVLPLTDEFQSLSDLMLAAGYDGNLNTFNILRGIIQNPGALNMVVSGDADADDGVAIAPSDWLPLKDVNAAEIFLKSSDDLNVNLILGVDAYGSNKVAQQATSVSTSALIVGTGGTSIAKILVGTVAYNPADLASATLREDDITIVGLAVGDLIFFNVPASLESGLLFVGCRVKTTDTAAVRIYNPTGGAVNGASLTWSYIIIRKT